MQAVDTDVKTPKCDVDTSALNVQQHTKREKTNLGCLFRLPSCVLETWWWHFARQSWHLVNSGSSRISLGSEVHPRNDATCETTWHQTFLDGPVIDESGVKLTIPIWRLRLFLESPT